MKAAVRGPGTGRGGFHPEFVEYLIESPSAIQPVNLTDADREKLEQMVDAEVLGSLEMALLAGRADAPAVAALVERGLARALRVIAPAIELDDVFRCPHFRRPRRNN